MQLACRTGRTRAAECLSPCTPLRAGTPAIDPGVLLTWQPLPPMAVAPWCICVLQVAMSRTKKLCAVIVDTLGREVMVRRPCVIAEDGWPAHPGVLHAAPCSVRLSANFLQDMPERHSASTAAVVPFEARSCTAPAAGLRQCSTGRGVTVGQMLSCVGPQARVNVAGCCCAPEPSSHPNMQSCPLFDGRRPPHNRPWSAPDPHHTRGGRAHSTLLCQGA